MRYATIKPNDTANAPGVNVSVYLQGCPHKCFGCFNPETWDPGGGHEFTNETMTTILSSLRANGIKRNLCILGGEPLADYNLFLTHLIIDTVKKEYPDTKIYIWTGYTIEELEKRNIPRLTAILKSADTLIDGRFEMDKRDLTLSMRGSSNQRIIDLRTVDFLNKI